MPEPAPISFHVIWGRSVPVIAILLTVVSPAVTADQAPLAFVFPPPGMQEGERLVAFVSAVLNFTPDFVLGPNHTSGGQLLAFEQGVVEIRLRNLSGETWTLHQPVVAKEDEVAYHVSLAGLPSVIEYDVAASAVIVTFSRSEAPSDGEPLLDRAKAISDRLGIPAGPASEWSVRPPRPLEMPILRSILPRSTQFHLECERCTVVERHVPGHSVSLNRLRALFSQDGALAALEVAYWIPEMGKSGFLSAEQAIEAARHSLEADGYHVEDIRFQFADLDRDFEDKVRVVYHWGARATRGPEKIGIGLIQDSQTGEILRTAEEMPKGGGGSTPGPPVALLLIALALSAVAYRRLRNR